MARLAFILDTMKQVIVIIKHQALIEAFLTMTLAYIGLSVFYKLYFHPLSRFPGPPLWRASRLPYTVLLLRGRLPLFALQLHKTYGPVVRVAPNELAWFSPQAWKDIYGHKRSPDDEFPKYPGFYSLIANSPSIATEPTHEGHRFVRRLLTPGFNDKTMRQQEPLIISYTDLFIKQLHKHCRDKDGNKTPINMVAWYNSLTFDIIGDLVFGEPFGSVAKGKEDPWVESINKFASIGVALILSAAHLGFQRPLLKLISFGNMRLEKHLTSLKRSLARRLEEQLEKPDLIDGLVNGKGGIKIDSGRVFENASILTIAGSETTASLLAGVTALLLRNQDCLIKATEEVRASFQFEDEITFSSVKHLRYLVACVNEGLRCYPPVPAGLPRLVPDGGRTIAGEFVAGQTIVAVWQYAINHSPFYFTDALEYKPDRWLVEDPGGTKDQLDAMQPFSVGPRDCIGRNLACAEMRTILARLLFNFDIAAADLGNNWLNHKAFVMWKKPPLNVFLVPRQLNRYELGCEGDIVSPSRRLNHIHEEL